MCVGESACSRTQSRTSAVIRSNNDTMAVIHPCDCARDRRARFMRRMSFGAIIFTSVVYLHARIIHRPSGWNKISFDRSPSPHFLFHSRPPLIAFLLLFRFTTVKCIFRNTYTEDRRAWSAEPEIWNSAVRSLETGFFGATPRKDKKYRCDLLCDYSLPISFIGRSTDRLYQSTCRGTFLSENCTWKNISRFFVAISLPIDICVHTPDPFPRSGEEWRSMSMQLTSVDLFIFGTLDRNMIPVWWVLTNSEWREIG